MKRSASDHFDVLVVGGGAAGAAVAIELLRKKRRVLLVERTRYVAPRPGEMLLPEVRPLLESLGAWERFEALAPIPCVAIRSDWGGRVEERAFLFGPWGSGWLIDRRRFDAMLADCVAAAGGQVRRGVRAEARGSEDGFVEVALDGKIIQARVVADATGRSAQVARAGGATAQGLDSMVAITGVLRPGAGAAPLDRSLWIESASEGWWYSAPLPGGEVIAAFMTDLDLLDCATRPAALWKAAVLRTAHTRSRLIGFELANAPRVRKSESAILDHAAGPNWIAVGDAAARFDPLTGSGVHAALASGKAAASAIDAFLDGDAAALAHFAAEVRRVFDRFVKERAVFYAAERRFAEHPFWRRRLAPTIA